MGTCIALHAAKRCDPLHEPVILIEKDRLGAGSSGRASGIVYQTYEERALAGMARDALRVYSGFEATTGRSVGFHRTGVLTLAGIGSRARLEEAMAMQESIGIHVKRVERDEIVEIAPGIEVEPDTIGCYEPDGGFIDPQRTIESFATLARDAGAVTRIGVADPEVIVEDGKAVGVRTSAGTFFAPQIVLATGSWTTSILAGLGVNLPMRLVRAEQHFFRMPSAGALDAGEGIDPVPSPEAVDPNWAELETRFTPSPLDALPVAHPVIFDRDRNLYVRCEPVADRTRVGHLTVDGFHEVDDPRALDGEVSEASSAEARRAVTSLLPIYRDQPSVGGHSFALALAPDKRPVIGPIGEIEGLYAVTGFTGNDFQLAPSIGEGMAQLLAGQPVSAFDTEFFSIDRLR